MHRPTNSQSREPESHSVDNLLAYYRGGCPNLPSDNIKVEFSRNVNRIRVEDSSFSSRHLVCYIDDDQSMDGIPPDGLRCLIYDMIARGGLEEFRMRFIQETGLAIVPQNVHICD